MGSWDLCLELHKTGHGSNPSTKEVEAGELFKAILSYISNGRPTLATLDSVLNKEKKKQEELGMWHSDRAFA